MAAPNYRQVAAQDAAKYGLGPWFLRQIQQESGFNPNAKSGAGAQGIAQFIPSTAKAYGLSNPYDAVASLDAAARYDRDLLKRYGSVPRALSAYNSGRPDAYQDPGFAGGQTSRYVKSILGGSVPNAVPENVGAEPVSGYQPAGMSPPGVPSPMGRQQLVQALMGASGSGDYSAFFQKLRQARSAPAAQVAPVAGGAPAPAAGFAPPPSPGGHGHVIGGQGENPGFLSRLSALSAYEGAPVNVNSGYRSYAKQAQLYANRASNPNPVAAPGHSLHEQGLAADGTVKGIPLGRLPAALLARFGLATVPNDPVHVQVAR